MNEQTAAQVKNPSSQPAEAHAPVCPEVFSLRKSCTADGVGLSHYILMETPKK